MHGHKGKMPVPKVLYVKYRSNQTLLISSYKDQVTRNFTGYFSEVLQLSFSVASCHCPISLSRHSVTTASGSCAKGSKGKVLSCQSLWLCMFAAGRSRAHVEMWFSTCFLLLILTVSILHSPNVRTCSMISPRCCYFHFVRVQWLWLNQHSIIWTTVNSHVCRKKFLIIGLRPSYALLISFPNLRLTNIQQLC